jgi:hypothetical protein
LSSGNELVFGVKDVHSDINNPASLMSNPSLAGEVISSGSPRVLSAQINGGTIEAMQFLQKYKKAKL